MSSNKQLLHSPGTSASQALFCFQVIFLDYRLLQSVFQKSYCCAHISYKNFPELRYFTVQFYLDSLWVISTLTLFLSSWWVASISSRVADWFLCFSRACLIDNVFFFFFFLFFTMQNIPGVFYNYSFGINGRRQMTSKDDLLLFLQKDFQKSSSLSNARQERRSCSS